MASYDFILDTEPMAQKVDQMATNVGAVGAAVTAMQVAVVATEKQTADNICRNLDNGFYMMVRSKLSQKVSQFTSRMNSRIGSMVETAEAIDHTRDQMDQDFHRIKARYVKLFDRLDRALQSRIRTLDKDAMALAEVRSSLLMKGQCKNAPAALCYSREIQVSALKAANAHMKVRAEQSLNSLGNGLEHIVSYSRTTGMVVKNRPASQSTQMLLPVVYAQTESLAAPGGYVTSVNLPEKAPDAMKASARTSIEPLVPQMATSAAGDMSLIRDAFVREMVREGVAQREQNLMLNLFDKSAADMRAVGQGDAS